MSGHSKWHKVKHKKEQTDSKRGKLFGQLARDIKSAAQSGRDPNTNATLREAIARAKKANLPQTNINRLLNENNSDQQTAIYEGYGPGGVAILITAETDNTNRTVSEIRAIFKKHNSSLGAAGSVRWKFSEQGIVVVDVNSATNLDLETLELSLIEAGATDLQVDLPQIQIICPPPQLSQVVSAARQADVEIISDQITYNVDPEQQVTLSDAAEQQLQLLLDALEDQTDIINVFSDFAPLMNND